MEKVFVKSIIENMGLFYARNESETLWSNGVDYLGGKFLRKKQDVVNHTTPTLSIDSNRAASEFFSDLGVDYSD